MAKYIDLAAFTMDIASSNIKEKFCVTCKHANRNWREYPCDHCKVCINATITMYEHKGGDVNDE